MAKADKESIRTKQAEHFKEILASAQEIIDDPESTPEEKAAAEQTITGMTDDLERLKTKYGVAPAGSEEPPAEEQPSPTT